MHTRIVELHAELIPLIENPPALLTADDRSKLMSVRTKIKNLADEPGVALTEVDETDRQYLFMLATIEASRQEDFYEKNGNKWV